MKKQMWTALAVLVSALLITGCTREAKESSVVRLSVNNLIKNSKIGTLTLGSSVSHIVVNVHGPGLPGPIYWNWDGHKNGTTVAPPAYIQLDVPSGSSRLIQVLLVIKDGTTGGMIFQYGDGSFDLGGGTQQVDVPIIATSAASGEEAEVAGRYLFADGVSGPTAEMELLYRPSVAGRPLMKIEEMSVINGWFNLFLVDGADFIYRFKHNGELFLGTSAGLDLADSMFAPSQNVLHIQKPGGWRWQGGSSTPEQASPGRTILGFFGPGANLPSARTVCYGPTGSPVAVNDLYTTVAHSASIYWNSVSGGSTEVRRLSAATNGLPLTDSICSSGTEFSDILKFDGTEIAQGKIKSVGFHGIFKLQNPSDYQALTVSGTAPSFTVNWDYVDASVIGNNGVDGVSIFANPNLSGDLGENNDSINCRALQNKGFVMVGESVASATPSVSFTMTGANVRIAACPFRNNFMGEAKHYFPGVEYRNESGGGGGLRLAFRAADGTSPATHTLTDSSTCQAYTIGAFNNSSPYSVPNTVTVNLTTTLASAGDFYASAGCSSTITSVDINSSSSVSPVFYVKGASYGYTTLQGQISASAFSSAYLDIGLLGTGSPTNLAINITASPQVGTCNRASIRIQAAGPQPINYGSMLTVNLTKTTITGDFYADSFCMGTPISSINIGANEQAGEFYFKATSVTAAGSITATGSPLSPVTSAAITPVP